MRTIMAFGFAALLSLLAIGAWSNATTHSVNRAEASAASSWPINPLELMRKLEGSGASAIRRALTRIPDELPVELTRPM